MASVSAAWWSLGGFAGVLVEPVRGDVEFGDWLRIGDFVIPAVLPRRRHLGDDLAVCARS